jgi:DNA-binding GntR family transcriptional regulator
MQAPLRAQVVNLFSLPVTLPDTDELLNAPAEWERVLADLAAAVESCMPFGIYQISESALCEHFSVSRTVTREVLARLHERGTIRKDRASHWLAGPLSARLLDDQHEVRRLLEPAALQRAAPHLPQVMVAGMMDRLDAAAAVGPTIPPAVMERLEADLHDTCLAGQPNRRILASIAQLQGARVVNRLFATHVVQHDESDLLAEHRLVLGHLRLGDANGAAAALRYHLDVDHDRTRDRLKVLSVFADPAVSPYLVRVF